MAQDLKKFANARFIKTIDLPLMRQLLERYAGEIESLDLSRMDEESGRAREALAAFFTGPEEMYPEGLVDDLHRIAELGNEQGLQLLLEQARAVDVVLIPHAEVDGDHPGRRLDPKHVALRAYLENRAVFDRAADVLALRAPVSPTEFVGVDEGVEAELNDETKLTFEAGARELFNERLMGRYCRIAWYPDAGETNVVVAHGSPVARTPVVADEGESLLTYRGVRHDVLTYDAATGRLKVGGRSRALRAQLASLFAEAILRRPTFFDHEDSQKLYTLRPIQEAGCEFKPDCSWDPGVRSCRIVEIQVTPVGAATGRAPSVIIRDPWNAVGRLGEYMPGLDLQRAFINYAKFAISFDVDGKTRRVTVRVKPPGIASFKRTRFEGRVMEILRRNGFCRDRAVPAALSTAAE